MHQQIKEIFDIVFTTPDGKKALEYIKDICEYDRRVVLLANERNQCYMLGKASVYSQIVEIMKQKTKKGKKNVGFDSSEW